jgi:hypothetical protein
MRANYGSQRFSTFDNLSPGSPPSTGGSLLTPGTTTSSGFLTDSPSANFLQNRDGAGAAEDPPEDPYLRPYWLMRALALSMKNQKGAYLNSQLFVPQGVWMLKNVKLKATDEKITCFSAMTMAVRQVLDIDYGNSSILLQVQFIYLLELNNRRLETLRERWISFNRIFCARWMAKSMGPMGPMAMDVK